MGSRCCWESLSDGNHKSSTRGLAKRRSCREHRPRLSTTMTGALKTSTASLLALALQTLHNIRPSIRPLFNPHPQPC
ncbi:hypothetical protein VTI74DRAFT_9906 [Chaetomium olivicolor]